MKVITYLSAVVVLLSAFCELGLCREDPFIRRMNTPGGIHDCKGFQNSAEIVSIGQFAVQEHNKKENTLLEFARVVKAKEQVVAGKMYYLTLEAIDAGKKQIYEAKVWVKPWMNFKQLQGFKPTHDASSSFTSTGLGGKRGAHIYIRCIQYSIIFQTIPDLIETHATHADRRLLTPIVALEFASRRSSPDAVSWNVPARSLWKAWNRIGLRIVPPVWNQIAGTRNRIAESSSTEQ